MKPLTEKRELIVVEASFIGSKGTQMIQNYVLSKGNGASGLDNDSLIKCSNNKTSENF